MRLRDLAFLLLGIILGSVAFVRSSPELSTEYGQCRFGQAKDGTYYDKRLNHSNYLTPRCASIALSDRFKGSTWGYRVAYIASGSVEGRDNAAQMNDGIPSSNPCSNEHWENCHSLFGGSGRMEGVQLSLTKDKRLSGEWWIRGEAGVLFFRDFFNGYAKPQDFDGAPMMATGAMGGTAVKWEGGGGLEQKSSWFDNPLPLLGVTVGYGSVYASARYHFPAEHRPGLSITDHSFLQLAIGIAWHL